MIQLLGKPVAESIEQSLLERSKKVKTVPGLAVVLVGEDPASQVYVSHKIKACARVGVKSFEYRLPSTASEAELLALIAKLNQDTQVHGILVQLPLPPHLNSKLILDAIDPRKDADGLTTKNMGLLLASRQVVAPCTPAGVMEILKFYNIDVEGKNAVVIGRSEIVGKPMALLLLQAQATVSVCHSKTKDLAAWIQCADLVVVAAGRPQFLKAEQFKKNAIVIDVGIHRQTNGKLCGDVDPAGAEMHLAAMTPVPGGVGPMTIAMLLKNTWDLYDLSQGKK